VQQIWLRYRHPFDQNGSETGRLEGEEGRLKKCDRRTMRLGGSAAWIFTVFTSVKSNRNDLQAGQYRLVSLGTLRTSLIVLPFRILLPRLKFSAFHTGVICNTENVTHLDAPRVPKPPEAAG
jgi:hypothetical protein